MDAISRDKRGIVLINNDLCIGCKECMETCPFGAMQFDDEKEIAVKCDLCEGRLENDEEPACSMTCPTGCIIWGDMKELSGKIEEMVIQKSS